MGDAVLVRLGAAMALAAGVMLAAGVALYAGLSLCQPGALPGDEAWMRLHLVRQGLAALTGGARPGCFTGSGGGDWLIRAGLAGPGLAGVLLGLALVWDLAGRRVRRRFLALRGGHAILAGPVPLLAGMAPRRGGRLWLAGDEAEARGHLRVNPWRDVQALRAADIAALGPGRAAVIVAATGNDLANLRLAEAALAAGHKGRLTVRVDQRGVRALAADDLRARAQAAGAKLVLAAPDALQLRAALRRGMHGRYLDDRAGVPHVALAGSGGRLGALAALVARQGFGLETGRPRLSLLRLGGAEPDLPAALTGGLVADLVQVRAEDGETDRLDAEIAALATSGPRLTAVYCTGPMAGLLAGRWARVLTGLHLPVPPLVALDAAGEAGAPLHWVPPPGLAEIEAAQDRSDARAMAAHAAYQDAQKRVRGAAWGGLPSERDWASLAERYREDNRAAADHADYKLALCSMVAVQGPGAQAAFLDTEIARLAEVEHARWVAARLVAGWRLGARDDLAMTHPDLVPFAGLDAAGRAKDADQVRGLSAMLARCGERIARLRPVAALPVQMPDPAGLARLDRALRQGGDVVPLLRVAADGPGLALAGAMQARGHLTEVVQAQGPMADMRAALGAHRRQVVADPAAVLADCAVVMDREGRVSDAAAV